MIDDAARRRRQPRRAPAAAEAVDEAAEPLETRGIIVVERGRFRVRERNVLRYYARTHRAPAARRLRPHALMLDAASEGLLPRRSRAADAEDAGVALRHGGPGSFARRFIAGETVDEAIAAARDARGARACCMTLDYLGESVATLDDGRRGDARLPAASSTRSSPSGIERNLSLKLTQLGLDVDRATVRRQPAPHPRRRPTRTGSSCASTWRTRRTPT